MNSERWLQVTAGKGPAECAWAVLLVIGKIQEEASTAGLKATVLEMEPGSKAGTAQSALMSIAGNGAETFVASWEGTAQWIARSPFRPEHKRKNWFVGIEGLEAAEETRFDTRDVKWETMRASGPGGQHVNRTESAVRVTHAATGLQAYASEERSQHRNRKLALARLARKLTEADAERRDDALAKRWRAHQEFERGNPVRTFRANG
jgi:peptide chain release factor